MIINENGRLRSERTAEEITEVLKKEMDQLTPEER